MAQEKWVTVEMGSTRKAILEEAIPQLQDFSEQMKSIALAKGLSLEEAEELFTLRIVKYVK